MSDHITRQAREYAEKIYAGRIYGSGPQPHLSVFDLSKAFEAGATRTVTSAQVEEIEIAVIPMRIVATSEEIVRLVIAALGMSVETP